MEAKKLLAKEKLIKKDEERSKSAMQRISRLKPPVYNT